MTHTVYSASLLLLFVFHYKRETPFRFVLLFITEESNEQHVSGSHALRHDMGGFIPDDGHSVSIGTNQSRDFSSTLRVMSSAWNRFFSSNEFVFFLLHDSAVHKYFVSPEHQELVLREGREIRQKPAETANGANPPTQEQSRRKIAGDQMYSHIEMFLQSHVRSLAQVSGVSEHHRHWPGTDRSPGNPFVLEWPKSGGRRFPQVLCRQLGDLPVSEPNSRWNIQKYEQQLDSSATDGRTAWHPCDFHREYSINPKHDSFSSLSCSWPCMFGSSSSSNNRINHCGTLVSSLSSRNAMENRSILSESKKSFSAMVRHRSSIACSHVIIAL